ncbi:DUF636 domain-containing protein [Mycena kentingensis (nom. inval.)]|nr:DUF636 domain-containing protein [Mycena kentingensis (nom. inval.)]
MTTNADTKIRLGSCLCKSIRFSVEGNPFSYAVCHCSNCKKFSGSSYMTNAFFAPNKVNITLGEELVKKYADNDTTSGNTLFRSFCSNCGCSLFLSSPTKTDWISACPYTLEDTADWVPDYQNRPEAKCAWVTSIGCLEEEGDS